MRSTKAQLLARNPITRTVAKRQHQQAQADARDQLCMDHIRMYLEADGAACSEYLHNSIATLATICLAAELMGMDNTDLRIARGALSAAKQMAKANRHDSANVPAIVTGMQAADRIKARLPSSTVAYAFQKLQQAIQPGENHGTQNQEIAP